MLGTPYDLSFSDNQLRSRVFRRFPPMKSEQIEAA